MELAQYSLEQLLKLHDQISIEIDARRSQAKRAFIEDVERKAQELGLEMSELLSLTTKSKGKSAGGKKVLPKYKNPYNPSETWTGRGRRPLWVESALSNGMDMDAMLIK